MKHVKVEGPDSRTLFLNWPGRHILDLRLCDIKMKKVDSIPNIHASIL